MTRTRQHRRVAARHGLVVEQLEGRRMLAFGVTTSTAATGQHAPVKRGKRKAEVPAWEDVLLGVRTSGER